MRAVVSIEFSKPRCTIYHFSKKNKNKVVVREGIHPPFFHETIQEAASYCRVFTLLPQLRTPTHLPTAYDVLLQYFWAYVDEVQTANYYYSKTQYFQHIKDEYGQYTYDVLVGKFIHLSNQFKDMFALTEWHMYGSSRLGVQKPKAVMLSGAEEGTGRELVHIEFEGTWNQYTESVDDTSNTTTTTYQMSYDYFTLTRGEKNYEMVNHLGNVLVIISDKKLKVCTGDTVNYYMADVLQATDYSAFGVILKDREYYATTTDKYRFGFNGQEGDNEMNGDGNSYVFKYRLEDARLGRFWSVDPISKSYPMLTPYQFAGNTPIWARELEGLESWYTTNQDGKQDATTVAGPRSDSYIEDNNLTHFGVLENKFVDNGVGQKVVENIGNLKTTPRDYDAPSKDPNKYLNCSGECIDAAKSRISKAYKDVTGINLLQNVRQVGNVPTTTFNRAWNVTPDQSGIPQDLKGTGSAGAMTLAGLGQFVNEHQIWTGGLKHGAVIQVFGTEGGYENALRGVGLGHSFIFLNYETDANGTITGMKIADQGYQNFGSIDRTTWAVWFGANIGTSVKHEVVYPAK